MESGIEYDIFFDSESIEWRHAWEKRISEGLNGASFLIPIITPNFINSKICMKEVEVFLKIEKGRRLGELLLPIYYIDINSELMRSGIIKKIFERQYQDFTKLRLKDHKDPQKKGKINEMAKTILRVKSSLKPIDIETTPEIADNATSVTPKVVRSKQKKRKREPDFLARIEKKLNDIAYMDPADLIDFMMKRFKENGSGYYDEELDEELITRAIKNLEKGSSPRVAFVGMTNSGKSNLINALWGSPVARSNIQPNLTDQIIAYKFPSELVVYDTPGVLSEISFENVTRLFLGLNPIEPQPKSMIPFRYFDESDINLEPEKIREEAPIDIVFWIVDFSRTSYADRGINNLIKDFYQELKGAYSGKLIIVGTHLDKVEDRDKEKLKAGWNNFLGSDLIPVSSVTNEGIKDLVFKLFSTMPSSVSLAKLQKSLDFQKKIDRQSFVILEISQILGKIVLQTGENTATIKLLIAELFSIIYWHYSVEEETWKSTNGDLLNIIKSLQEKGIKKNSRQRDPNSYFEKLLSIFGWKFSEEYNEYSKLGVDGLIEMIIAVYNTISNFEGQKHAKKEEEIRKIIADRRDNLAHHVGTNSKEELSKEIRRILVILLSESGKINLDLMHKKS